MKCPKCGYVYRTRWSEQLGKIAGLGTSVCAALLGQAHLAGEPWEHVIAIAGIVGVAFFGSVLQLYKRSSIADSPQGE